MRKRKYEHFKHCEHGHASGRTFTIRDRNDDSFHQREHKAGFQPDIETG